MSIFEKRSKLQQVNSESAESVSIASIKRLKEKAKKIYGVDPHPEEFEKPLPQYSIGNLRLSSFDKLYCRNEKELYLNDSSRSVMKSTKFEDTLSNSIETLYLTISKSLSDGTSTSLNVEYSPAPEEKTRLIDSAYSNRFEDNNLADGVSTTNSLENSFDTPSSCACDSCSIS